MAVTFHLPPHLLSIIGERGPIRVKGTPGSLYEALEMLWKTYSILRDRMCDEQGQIRPYVRLFVGTDPVSFTDGLANPLHADSVIFVATGFFSFQSTCCPAVKTLE